MPRPNKIYPNRIDINVPIEDSYDPDNHINIDIGINNYERKATKKQIRKALKKGLEALIKVYED